ncbi:IclR family transcriptional regulator [Halogeometricum limi]|uniref:Transcriptional regulator n=1 Tax=Halogeometricum limi TaxID=555875 RepID=A0A1I6IDV3_9EURY|nr:IclR family transcriptional regulator [Halogeometricum limi]SFR64881.1 transcriptional regulator [Halogeometricum limi]
MTVSANNPVKALRTTEEIVDALERHERAGVTELATKTNELITLTVEEHGQGIYLDVNQDSADIHYPAISGARVKIHCTAAGKAMFAHLSDARVEEVIERHGLPAQTDETLTTREELFEELETVRERGYAYDRQEFRNGMRSIGAPILDESGNVLGGLSVAGPTHRLDGDRLETDLPTKLFQSVNVVELNYNEPTIK